jgi:hypothetical protein
VHIADECFSAPCKVYFLFYGFETRCSAAEQSVRAREKGGKLSESREKRDEFLTAPRPGALLGEPQAKLLGGFSLVRFFVPHKEMNVF